jgi:hypothetical protein
LRASRGFRLQAEEDFRLKPEATGEPEATGYFALNVNTVRDS